MQGARLPVSPRSTPPPPTRPHPSGPDPRSQQPTLQGRRTKGARAACKPGGQPCPADARRRRVVVVGGYLRVRCAHCRLAMDKSTQAPSDCNQGLPGDFAGKSRSQTPKAWPSGSLSSSFYHFKVIGNTEKKKKPVCYATLATPLCCLISSNLCPFNLTTLRSDGTMKLEKKTNPKANIQ